MLLNQGRDAALHFYMANFTTMRKEIFPALVTAYQAWLDGDSGKLLKETVKRGAEHWQKQAENALEIYRNRESDESKELMKALAGLGEHIAC
jgi:hypothetical protein